MNFKKIILGSACAMASFGLFACGDDESTGGVDVPTGVDPPVGPVIDLPEASDVSPIVFSTIEITPMAGAKGMQGSLSGMVKLDPNFIVDTQKIPYTAEVETKIDSVAFFVARPIQGELYQEPVHINLDGVVFPTEMVPLSQKYFEYASLSSCGDFNLIIVAYASSKEAGLKTTTYTSVFDQLKFTRPETECKAPEPVVSSSSAEPAACTPVTAHSVKLSNSVSSDQSALNFDTGLADNPHISISFSNGAGVIVPGAGISIFEESSQITGLVPTKTPICREDFTKSSFELEEVTSGIWFVAVDAAGKIYPVMVNKVMTESNTKGYMELTYFN